MIIDGKIIATKILADVAAELGKTEAKPVLCDILVGADPVSVSYVAIKEKAALAAGFEFLLEKLHSASTTEDVVVTIKRVQADPRLGGLIVQLPLPAHIDRKTVLDAIDIQVDVDCLSTEASKAFFSGNSKLIPPTAGAIMAVLDSLKQDFSEMRFLVIGQGDLVGKPVTHLLKSRGFMVTTADSSTQNLANITPFADVVISATGQAGLIYGSMIKPGAIVVDAGTAESGGGIVGDVDFESVNKVAAYLSPVPGGVGPVTVAKLLENVLEASKTRFLS
jgi:methylenetetrahydrofolate dehydrogenase (NADP+)/methenyltetrahydrofolate cyclohydrolase